ncbi:MAG: complex I NDUFA9 subunit family protein [Comamonadaceae bacterium]
MKNVLVLGGTGFVGAPVCEMLLRQGWQVTVPSRQLSNAETLHRSLPEAHLLELDVHDETALAQALAGQQAVVNLVAILHGTAGAFEKVHVDLPHKLARACGAAGVRQMVHLSALGADSVQPQSAPSMYLRSKGQGEAVLLRAAGCVGQQGGFDLTVLRPSVIFGVRDKFLNVFAQLQKVLPVMPLAGATTRFQPVWVQDVASAVVRSLERTDIASAPDVPLVLELCGPDVFTLRELVQLSARLSGIRGGRGRPVLALPGWLGRWQATLMELAPGEPLMSRDNLDSMRIDNVASGKVPGLSCLGISATALLPIASAYLDPKQFGLVPGLPT